MLAGWRGVALVALTYAYFLIFAQFGFLARLAKLGVPASALTPVMAAMAVAGILFSLATPRFVERIPASSLVRGGLGLSGVAALLVLSPMASMYAVPIALLIGAGLGTLTVALVTHLPSWCDARPPVLIAGVGTGLGYAFCNVPAIFTAPPELQAAVALVLCVVGIVVSSSPRGQSDVPSSASSAPPFLLLLAAFAALVWLDSAAFFIIQHTAALKAETWSGNTHLWCNAAVHFVAAIGTACLLRAQRLSAVLAAAVLMLGAASLLLVHTAGALAASLLYPAGVSCYSVALVAYPSSLCGALSLSDRARRAGWIYAVAGWIGSALGIGMGQHLGFVPPGFVLLASAVVLLPLLCAIWKVRSHEVALLTITLLCAAVIWRMSAPSTVATSSSAEERGRSVYIAEGCISCHSQYVRPSTPDEMMWGPVIPVQQVRAETPPLIGNRRQGPDLAEIGARRSPLWLRVHLIAPDALSDHSPMPSYAFLFTDERGDDLVAYLVSLHAASAEHARTQAAWSPASDAWTAASPGEGERLYLRDCATCHDDRGIARLRWYGSFRRLPPERDALFAFAQTRTRDELARLVRFGVPGTDMPGHEMLTDHDIASLVLWLERPALQPSSQ